MMWEKRTRKEFLLLLLLFTVFYIYPTLFTFFHGTQRNGTTSATCNTHFPTCNTVATKTPEHKRNTVLFIVRGGETATKRVCAFESGPRLKLLPFPSLRRYFLSLSFWAYTREGEEEEAAGVWELASLPPPPCESGGLTPRPRWGRPLWGRRRRLWGGHWRGERLCNMWRKRELGGRGVKRKKELHKEVSLFGTYFNWRFFLFRFVWLSPTPLHNPGQSQWCFWSKGKLKKSRWIAGPKLEFFSLAFFYFSV